MTFIHGERDSIIKTEDTKAIYNSAIAKRKQFITVRNYPDRDADNYFTLNRSYIFSGKKGISLYHHYGVLQWLKAAAFDVADAGNPENPFLYGDRSQKSGDP